MFLVRKSETCLPAGTGTPKDQKYKEVVRSASLKVEVYLR